MKLTRRAYVSVGRIMSPLALIGLRFYTLLTRRPRVRIVVMNELGEILLVQGVISHLGMWTLPGGGVNRHEALENAAERELFEETGIKKPAGAFRFLRTIEKSESGLAFVAPLYMVSATKADLSKTPHNPREIADIGWFKLDDLPDPMAPIVSLGIDEYKRVKQR